MNEGRIVGVVSTKLKAYLFIDSLIPYLRKSSLFLFFNLFFLNCQIEIRLEKIEFSLGCELKLQFTTSNSVVFFISRRRLLQNSKILARKIDFTKKKV